MKPGKMNDKKKQTRNEVRSSLRSSNGASSSSETSPNISSRPKRIVNKRSLDVSDFLTSHEEERQLAKALKESLKDLKKNDAVASTNRTAPKNCVTEPKETSVSRSSKDPPPPLEAVLTRPKRDAAQRASVITDLLCFKSKEERQLRKAIELSKRTILEDKRKREETSSITSPSSPVTDLSAAASTSSASNINPAHRRREEDLKSQNSDASSMDEMILKKPKIPPQRKFAQNSIPGNCMHASMCTPLKHLSSQSYIHNPHNKAVQLKEVFSAITPSTEDFLTFLCLRNAPALPQKVDLILMNEKAIKDKQLQGPKTVPSTVLKSLFPPKIDGVRMNGTVQNSKNVDNRKSTVNSSSLPSNPFQRNHAPHRKSNIKLAIKSESPLIHDKPLKRVKKAVIVKKVKSNCSLVADHKVIAKPNSKLDLTPTKRITRSASSVSYPESTSSTPVISVEDEIKAQQEKKLKEQMIAIEKQHQVRRRFSSDSSLHSSDSSSSESLPSTSSSASINISRVTRSIETLKQLREIGQQSKIKSSNTPSRCIARGHVASKAILQKAKRNLNSKSCSNGKLSRISH